MCLRVKLDELDGQTPRLLNFIRLSPALVPIALASHVNSGSFCCRTKWGNDLTRLMKRYEGDAIIISALPVDDQAIR